MQHRVITVKNGTQYYRHEPYGVFSSRQVVAVDTVGAGAAKARPNSAARMFHDEETPAEWNENDQHEVVMPGAEGHLAETEAVASTEGFASLPSPHGNDASPPALLSPEPCPQQSDVDPARNSSGITTVWHYYSEFSRFDVEREMQRRWARYSGPTQEVFIGHVPLQCRLHVLVQLVEWLLGVYPLDVRRDKNRQEQEKASMHVTLAEADYWWAMRRINVLHQYPLTLTTDAIVVGLVTSNNNRNGGKVVFLPLKIEPADSQRHQLCPTW